MVASICWCNAPCLICLISHEYNTMEITCVAWFERYPISTIKCECGTYDTQNILPIKHRHMDVADVPLRAPTALHNVYLRIEGGGGGDLQNHSKGRPRVGKQSCECYAYKRISIAYVMGLYTRPRRIHLSLSWPDLSILSFLTTSGPARYFYGWVLIFSFLPPGTTPCSCNHRVSFPEEKTFPGNGNVRWHHFDLHEAHAWPFLIWCCQPFIWSIFHTGISIIWTVVFFIVERGPFYLFFSYMNHYKRNEETPCA